VWGGHLASLWLVNGASLSAPVVVCFCGGFPGATGRHGVFPEFLPVRWAGLALFKVLQVVRSAEIFQRRQALSGFSPEQRGGSSHKKFLPVSQGRLGRCSGLFWPGLPCPCVKVPLVSWSLRKRGPALPFPGSFAGALCHGWLLPLVGLLPVLSREALVANPRIGGFPVRLPGSWRGLAAGNRVRFGWGWLPPGSSQL